MFTVLVRAVFQWRVRARAHFESLDVQVREFLAMRSGAVGAESGDLGYWAILNITIN
jgi:hypothetical protein